jgi:hypothetical protein
MSVVPSIYEGMLGKKEAVVRMPTMQTGSPVLTSDMPLLGLVKYTKAPNTLSAAIDYSTRRGVLPCRGITHHVLRTPATNAANAYQAPMGFTRGQPRGLASLNEYPTSLPLMPLSDSMNVAKNSPLGQPL